MSSELLDWADQQCRKNDPYTAKLAAQEIKEKLPLRCHQFMCALDKLGFASANEIAKQVAPDNFGLFGSIRRRASDLHKQGLIRVVEKRKCEVTGKVVSVYGVVK